ncbi:MAG: elongation factor G [Acidobacteria bacterium]|nr:elongation factor G [Acidobacteriota bacterium]
MTAATFSTENIRNIAVVGHSDTGKTSLVSAMLFDGGAINRFAKVDDGHTITDFDDDEIDRKITINTAVAHFEHEGKKINLIDTPGYGIYTTEAMQGLRVADTALLMISAVAGIEVQTEKLWKAAAHFQMPVILAVNLMDRDRASFPRTLAALQKKYGREVVPVVLPIGQESSFQGVVDLISGKAFTWDGEEGANVEQGDPPAEMADEAASAREALMEMIAEQDEELMESYLDKGELDPETFRQGLAKAFLNRAIFPVFALAAGKNMGVQPLMQAISDFAPAPDWRPIKARNVAGEEVELPVSDDQPAAAYVFKTFSDPFAGRITIFRVFTGKLIADSTVKNANRNASERLGGLAVMQGKDLIQVPELSAGDIGAVPKLKETKTGDTLSTNGDIIIPPVKIPEPAISFAIEPKSKGDEDKISSALVRIRDEDPTITVGRDPQTKELLISGAGQLHVEVIIGRLKKRYKVDVTMKPPKVPYRETVTKPAEATARHKKQTGGHGQFAEASVKMEPLPRGGGYEFVDKIFGGAISQTYRPAVDKGIQEAAQKGYLAGYPVVDFRITLVDGKEHPVDSSEMAFKIAGRKAFKACMAKANPTLLEPVMKIDVFTPDEFMGDVMGDLNSRRGRVQGMDSESGTTIIHALVPLAEMLTYAPNLRSISGGRAEYSMEFSHYDEVPKQLQEKIIAANAREEEEDED